jgi:hypothetical protein
VVEHYIDLPSLPPGRRSKGRGATMHSPAARLLADLVPGACRWPIGEPEDLAFRWCGKRAEPLHPYCSTHAEQARPSRIIPAAGAHRAKRWWYR